AYLMLGVVAIGAEPFGWEFIDTSSCITPNHHTGDPSPGEASGHHGCHVGARIPRCARSRIPEAVGLVRQFLQTLHVALEHRPRSVEQVEDLWVDDAVMDIRALLATHNQLARTKLRELLAHGRGFDLEL